MRRVRANTHFWENKDEARAASDADALAKRIERMVASWMLDTGYWDVSVGVDVKPATLPGHFEVNANVYLVAKPLRAEAGGVPTGVPAVVWGYNGNSHAVPD